MKMTFMILSLIFLPYSIKASAEAEVIKSKNLNNNEAGSISESGSEGGATITPAQAEDLKKQIERLKANQKKAQEVLEELDKE